MKEGAQRTFSFVDPMNALPVQQLPEGDWLYEMKLDGYRPLGFKNGKEARLISRNDKPLNYPQLLDALKSLPAETWSWTAKLSPSTRKAALRFSSSRCLTQLLLAN